MATTLKCRRETLRKLTMRLRESAWFFQGYHTVLLMTHETSEDAPRGRWIIHVVNRHSLHRIYAAPGKWRRLRWHLRRGDVAAWQGFVSRIKKWALAMIFRKNKGSDGKHKGFSPGISDRARGARSPNCTNRAALRRFGGVAARLDANLSALPGAPRVKLYGWLVNRLSEQHSQERIRECFAHAVKLLRKRRQTPIANVAAWVSGVAGYHLATDGLVPAQRRRERQKGSGLAPAAFNDVESGASPIAPASSLLRNCFEPGPLAVYVDGNGDRWLCTKNGRKKL